MTQKDRRVYLIGKLFRERNEQNAKIPENPDAQRKLLRALLNVRPPQPADDGFLKAQDEYLRQETARKGITDFHTLSPFAQGLYLWQGDITTLKCDGIVNAANQYLLGCFLPNHLCIDNAIHTFAGVQLRLDCARIMEKQGQSEETGKAKITPAYNLPCKYILHTVGPIVNGNVTERNKNDLANCYRSCLRLADENRLESLAFCCISTGEFRFPNESAARIALKTVASYKNETGSSIKVIFNVFKDEDYEIYRRLLGSY